jgi:RNA polymerase sigma factor (sigma-70 family)
MDLREFKIKVFPLKNKMFRLAHQMLDDAEDARDTVQDAFIRLWNIREKLDQYRSVEALAVVTTRNLCLDRIKSKKQMTGRIENHKDEVEEALNESKQDLSDVVKKIKEIIRTLPDQQKTIIHLRDIEGFEFEEIAQILGMNENAIRVNLSRARKKIREILLKNNLYEFQRN